MISQYYCSGFTSRNLPSPNEDYTIEQIIKYTQHVKDEAQIDNGDFAIPENCYGVRFMIASDEAPLYESEEYPAHSVSPLFIKKENFYNQKKVLRVFGENSDLYKRMRDNDQEYTIDLGNGEYSLPVEYEDLMIVEGEDHHYNMVMHLKNPAYGQKPETCAEDLALHYLERKKFFDRYFSPN